MHAEHLYFVESLADFYLFCYVVHRHLHSFPTRRSSDLICVITPWSQNTSSRRPSWCGSKRRPTRCCGSSTSKRWPIRSEEHTSELQSQANPVCRLLLEKKK